MGRIKTQLIKRTTGKMLEAHPEKFTDNFEKNKELVSKHTNISSPKIRNVLAGYITRRVRQEKRKK